MAPDTNARLVAVWRVVAAIPVGSVLSYGEVARLAGYPNGARYVGYALSQAPKASSLPWHRVVAAGGRIAFPVGSKLYREQRRRLLAEGMRVHGEKVAITPVADMDLLLWSQAD